MSNSIHTFDQQLTCLISGDNRKTSSQQENYKKVIRQCIELIKIG